MDDYTYIQQDVLRQLRELKERRQNATTKGEERDIVAEMRRLYVKWADERIPEEAFLLEPKVVKVIERKLDAVKAILLSIVGALAGSGVTWLLIS